MSSKSHPVSNNDNADESDHDVAFAAEAAAQAVEAADAATARARQHQTSSRMDHHQASSFQQHNNLVCRICRSGDDERPMLRFLPVEHDMATASVAPHVFTFGDDICVHVFCGKTASILPNVNQPELEILSKAGLKNKHGIGPEVNAALARTRCAVLNEPGVKDKHFYLVREFEAHLAAIRTNNRGRQSVPAENNYNHDYNQNQNHTDLFASYQQQEIPSLESHIHHYGYPPLHLDMNPAPVGQQPQHKTVPHKATAGQLQKSGSTHPGAFYYEPELPSSMISNGKIKCRCGGSFLPSGRRSHQMTKRHQKWLEDQNNGLLGAETTRI